MRLSIWPGLALAGGVVIAAVVVLILLGGGSPGGASLPSGSTPGDTRLFPGQGAVAGRTRSHPHTVRPRGVSAAESEYLTGGNRGLVLGGP